MYKKIIVFLFILSSFLIANTQWKVLKEGISYHKDKFYFKNNRNVLLHSFKIKQNKFKISIKSFHDLNKSTKISLKKIRKENNYLLTISGGFYLPEKGYQSPQGLIIENGKIFFPKDNKLSGILWIKNDYLTLSPTNDIPTENSNILHGIDYAIQGYPRIIDPINKIGIRKQGNAFHRVAICTQMDSEDIILFITDKKYSGITLLELAHIMKDNKNFNCKIALNLDGGPAPGISVSEQLMNLEIKEGWQLPNILIFQEK